MVLSSLEIAERLAEVNERITAATRRAGRSPDAVTLVAVTKKHPAALIEAAYAQGLRHFGENRVEEAEGKITALRSTLPGDVTWHMIGHIQSRKTADVSALFDWVHSVDRFKIARRIASARTQPQPVDMLLEMNVSGEDSKYGFMVAEEPGPGPAFEALCADVEQILALPQVRLRGLMTMAPYTEQPETVRYVFGRLRGWRDLLAERFPAGDWSQLSMGMTADYEVAIEEGATLIRLGTALFGPR